MLRSFLIYLSKAAWAQNLVTNWSFAWRTASRFIAGTKLTDAMRVVKELNAKGINATLDHLGEHTSTPEESQQATDDIFCDPGCPRSGFHSPQQCLHQVDADRPWPRREPVRQNLERILARAKQNNTFVRIDIEDTPYTEKTINIYYLMREKGYTNVGMAVQSYLFRAEADTRRLVQDKITIRLVKGAYKEPPDKAFPSKADVDANFDLLTKILIDASLAHQTTLSKTVAFHPSRPLARTMKNASLSQNNTPKKSAFPKTDWNSKCCTAFGATCRRNL